MFVDTVSPAGTMLLGSASFPRQPRPVPALLPVGALSTEVLDLLRTARHAEGAAPARLAAMHARGDLAVEGRGGSLASWLIAHTGMPRARALTWRQTATQLPHPPAMAEALTSGEVTPDHAAPVFKAAHRGFHPELTARFARPVTSDHTPDHPLWTLDEVFADLARHEPAGTVARAVKEFLNRVDEQRQAGEYARRHQRRHVQLAETLDGVWQLEGSLDPESGTTVHLALKALMCPRGPEDKRTAGQRRADALAELARGTGAATGTSGPGEGGGVADVPGTSLEPSTSIVSLKQPASAAPAASNTTATFRPPQRLPRASQPRPLPSPPRRWRRRPPLPRLLRQWVGRPRPLRPPPVASQRPTSVSTASLESPPPQLTPLPPHRRRHHRLRRPHHRRRLAARRRRPPPPPHPPWVDLEGHAIPAPTARRIACDATVIPAVLGGDGRVLDVGRGRRLVSPAQRRALAIEQPTCMFGTRTISWRQSDAHHIVPWSQGGPTTLPNLVHLCHTHGWTIHRTPDGAITTTSPDGTEHRRPLHHAGHRRTAGRAR